MILKISILIFLQCTNKAFGDDLVIEAGDLGKIKGFEQTTVSSLKKFVVYAGIPFAQPTMKENRFQPSQLRTGPLTKNDSVFFATDLLQLCPQNSLLFQKKYLDGSMGPFLAAVDKDMRKKLENQTMEDEFLQEDTFSNGSTSGQHKIFGSHMGKEDCLVVNVNTPMNSKFSKDKLPVIVFIHGGSFTGVWGSLFNGARFLEKDVILVTLNYRLGILGFFNLGIDEAPGNAGLYDCITALKWVQRYISYFGGDPDRVTISGQSAGASLVTHLMASPLAVGLFHRAIAASGSALQQWSTAIDPIPESLKVARNAGCYEENWDGQPFVHAIADCMQKKSIGELLHALNTYVTEDRLSGSLGFWAACPSIQSKNLNIEIVLPEHPLKTFASGKQINVPLLMGATKHDGSYVLKQAQESFLTPNGLLKEPGYIQKTLMIDVLSILGVTDDSMAIVDAVEETYLGESMRSDKIEEKWPGLIDIFSVFFFKSMSYRTLDFHATIQFDCYWYSFDYSGFTSLTGLLNFAGSFPMGVAHGDDMLYLYQLLPLLTFGDRKVSSRVVDYWVNFAYYGNPNGESKGNLWPQYSGKNPSFLRIDTEETVRTNYKRDWKHAAEELFATKNKSSNINEIKLSIHEY